MSTSSSSSGTIIMVDDNLDLLELYQDALGHLGHYTVLTATNGAAALQLVHNRIPDCMIIDVVMPHLNGNQLVRALRGDPKTAHIPLIILTALTQEKNEYESQAAGSDAYLIKPVTPLELIFTIQQVLLISYMERELRYRNLAEDPPTQP